MIPKKIHYCWFGGKELPKLAKKCIASWQKFLPDYEIIEWNEKNFDINESTYIKEIYQAKKYAFVSDYVRVKVLYKYGGIYFDTDVELIKPIDDIIEKGAFMCFEDEDNVAPGLGMMFEPKHKFLKELLDIYEQLNLFEQQNTLKPKTIVFYTMEILKKYGLTKGTQIQKIEGIYLYPKEYFSPKHWRKFGTIITENTRAIHHFAGSWLTLGLRIKYFILKIAGENAEYIFKTKKFLKKIFNFL